MTIQWITIKVADFEKSKEFYRDYLEMKAVHEFSPNESMMIAFFEADNGMQVELIYDKSFDHTQAHNTAVSLGICTPDYDKMLQIGRERKIVTIEPVILGGNMECFFVSDPDGVGIQISKGE